MCDAYFMLLRVPVGMTNTCSVLALMCTLIMKKSRAGKRCKVITLLHVLGMVMVTSQLLLTLWNYSLAVYRAGYILIFAGMYGWTDHAVKQCMIMNSVMMWQDMVKWATVSLVMFVFLSFG